MRRPTPICVPARTSVPSFLEYRGAPKIVLPSRTAQDPELAKRLWEWSVEATGVDPALPVPR